MTDSDVAALVAMFVWLGVSYVVLYVERRFLQRRINALLSFIDERETV